MRLNVSCRNDASDSALKQGRADNINLNAVAEIGLVQAGAVTSSDRADSLIFASLCSKKRPTNSLLRTSACALYFEAAFVSSMSGKD